MRASFILKHHLEFSKKLVFDTAYQTQLRICVQLYFMNIIQNKCIPDSFLYYIKKSAAELQKLQICHYQKKLSDQNSV